MYLNRSDLVKPAKTFGWIIIIWTTVAIFFTLETDYSLAVAGVHQPLGSTLVSYLVVFETYALLTPFVLALGRRFRFKRSNWVKPLLAHMGGWITFALAHSVLRLATLPIAPLVNLANDQQLRPSWSTLRRIFLHLLDTDLWTYAVILVSFYFLVFYRAQRERRLREAELKGQLSKAELTVLKAQIQPHFLFNTLHAISAMAAKDVDLTQEMVAHLARLLRMSIENATAECVPLSHEVDFCREYLELQRLRFQDRLYTCFEIAPETLDAMVPSLLIQPLVENSVRHAIEKRSETGWIRVHSQYGDGMLTIEVTDSGGDKPIGLPVEEGTGLSNLKGRLALLYGDKYRMLVSHHSGEGLKVMISIPFEGRTRALQIN